MKLTHRNSVVKSVLLLLLSLSACVSISEPATVSQLVTVKIGTQPWIGYGPWWIAEEKGMFEKHGLNAELVNFVEDKEVNAALASGTMHAANMGSYQAIKLFSAGLDMRIILAEDTSYQADGVLASVMIQSIQELKGKKVAYEEGTVGDVLINYALQQDGLTFEDIQPVFMPASNAGAALIAGQVDAAVTYEPYISAVLNDKQDLHLLYTAAERPGIIADVLVVSTKFLEENPSAVRALLRVWDEGVAYYKSNPEDAKSIIAKGMGSNYEELKSAFDGIDLYDLADNRQILSNEFKATLADGAQVAQSIGLLDTIPDLNILIDTGYLGE